MEATMETEEVMEEKNPNALVLIDEGKQFAVTRRTLSRCSTRSRRLRVG